MPVSTSKSIKSRLLIGVLGGFIVGALVGLFIAATAEPTPDIRVMGNGAPVMEKSPPNPAFEKLTEVFGSRSAAIIVLSSCGFGFLGLILSLMGLLASRGQAKQI